VDARESVRRWAEEVISSGRLEALDEVCTPEAAEKMRAWIEPFRRSFPDVEMKVVEVIAEGDRVAAHFTCSATHTGEWRGAQPSGRRFEDVDEVYFFTLSDGLIADFWGIEDNASRERQLNAG
jgi:predicted ester cyclase